MSRSIHLPTLLVVTDNASIRFWIKKHLDAQFFILHAKNSSDAMQALSANLNLIFIDAELEEALQLSAQLSQMNQNGLIPIFLITGRLKKSFRDQAKACGVTDFLTAPLDLEEVRTKIASAQKNASMRQKTEDLALKIQTPLPSNASLKHKTVLTDSALRLFARAKKEGKSVTLLLLKIDEHPSTKITSLVSSFLQTLLRPNDLILSTAEGKEVILLPDITAQQAKIVAERLRTVIQDHPFPSERGPQYVTVSIAVSSLDASEQSFHKMLDSATKSLKTQTTTNLIISLDEDNDPPRP